MPLQSARWVVLVGDQAQLEPQHIDEVVNAVAREIQIPKKEVVRSDFARVFESAYGAEASARLEVQYRMLPAIGELASRAFYSGILKHGRQEQIIPADCLTSELAMPLTWIETDSLGEAGRQTAGSSRSQSLENPAEADLIVTLLRRLEAQGQFVEWVEG